MASRPPQLRLKKDEPATADAPAPQNRVRFAALYGTIAALGVAVLLLVVMLLLRSRPGDFSYEQVQEIAKTKAEAERLAVEGKLAESHAKYQQIEQLIAGRR